MRHVIACVALGLLSACHSGGSGDVPGNAEDNTPFDLIGADELVRFVGTEPFWGGEVRQGTLLYTTPEQPDGVALEVKRFAGRGGLSYSGKLDDAAFDLMISHAPCSDGMSDRTYPFTVSLSVQGEMRQGCAWTDKSPFTGEQAP